MYHLPEPASADSFFNSFCFDCDARYESDGPERDGMDGMGWCSTKRLGKKNIVDVYRDLCFSFSMDFFWVKVYRCDFLHLSD